MAGSQTRAVRAHRRRQEKRAVVRVEVQAPATDVALIRAVAEGLRSSPTTSRALRSRLRQALRPTTGDILQRLACDLPEEVVDQVLTRPLDHGRPVQL